MKNGNTKRNMQLCTITNIKIPEAQKIVNIPHTQVVEVKPK